MKTYPYWSFLRIEMSTFWLFLAIPACGAAEMWIGSMVPSRPRDLPMILFLGCLWVPIAAVWGYNMAFLGANFGFSRCNRALGVLGVPLEFAFSRALSRRTIFAAKATVAWLCLGLPMLSLLIRGWLQPDGTMYVPVRPSGVTQQVAEAYGRLFPGAALGRERALTTLSLPHAGIGLALMICLAGIIFASCFQALMALAHGRPILTRVVALGGFFVPTTFAILSLWPGMHLSSGPLRLPGDPLPRPAVMYWFNTWASGAAWTERHLTWLVPLVLAAAVGSWQYAACRFARQELPA